MNTENTVYDENTVYNDPVANNGQVNDNRETQPQSKGGAPVWVSVASGAGAGLLVGAASSFFATRVYAASVADEEPTPDNHDTTVNTDGQQTTNFVGGEVQMATGVNDDMSFNEAFAAARAEVGAGGVFEWHGNIYGTYYKDEWDSMTAEQRDAFGQSVGGYSASTADAGHDTMAQHQETQTTAPAETVTAETEHIPADDVVVVESDYTSEPDVQVLGMVYDDESGANVGAMSVDGQEVYLIDVDPESPGVGEFDFIAADLNNDGQISDDEIVDIQDQHIDVAQFGGMSNPSDPMLDGGQDDMLAQNGNLPDYVNDADMGDYVG